MTKILFFADTRERLGLAELDWEMDQATTVADLRAALAQQGERWQFLAASDLLCAVNQTLCDSDTPVKPGDEVAFFPPVTGG